MDNGSIFIAIVKFARDPNKKPRARQFIVLSKNEENVKFLETEKTIGKRKFDQSNILEIEKKYYILTPEENVKFGFKYPTAVNCYECFTCSFFQEIVHLKDRDLTEEVYNKIKEKFEEVIRLGLNLSDVKIEIEELKQLNARLN